MDFIVTASDSLSALQTMLTLAFYAVSLVVVVFSGALFAVRLSPLDPSECEPALHDDLYVTTQAKLAHVRAERKAALEAAEKAAQRAAEPTRRVGLVTPIQPQRVVPVGAVRVVTAVTLLTLALMGCDTVQQPTDTYMGDAGVVGDAMPDANLSDGGQEIDGGTGGCNLVTGDSYLPVDLRACPGIAVIRYYVSNVDTCTPGDYANVYGHMDVACSTWEQPFVMGVGDTEINCDGTTYLCHVSITDTFHVDCVVSGGASCRITFDSTGMVLVDAGR